MHTNILPSRANIRSGRYFCLFLLIIIFFVTTFPVSQPVYSTEISLPIGTATSSYLIAFTSRRDGNDEIYTMQSNGSIVGRLTDHPGIDSSPNWSPDGKKIVFASNRHNLASSFTDIYVMNADGTNIQRLTFMGGSDPAWSPDGQYIAFYSYGRGLYIMQADGSEARQLVPFVGSNPSWSPDGKSIVFEQPVGGVDPVWQVAVVNVDSLKVTNLHTGERQPKPIWSPTGETIAFVDFTGVGNRIFLMNADGSNVRVLPGQEVFRDSPNDPSWSTDSIRLTLEIDSSIYVINTDDSGFTFLSEGKEPAWQTPPILKSWTLMFYFGGDNGLSQSYDPIFNFLELAANNPYVNIIVLWDKIGSGNSAYFKVKYDSDIRKIATYTSGIDMFPIGVNNEVNTGDGSVLSDYVVWARTKYPAQHYSLILSDHGSGLRGTMFDETNSNDYITLPELKFALKAATENYSNIIDVLYLDSCLMGMIEVVYQVRSSTDFFIASQNLQFAFPAPYYYYVNRITNSTTPSQLASIFVTSYDEICRENQYACTMSAGEMSRLDSLVSATNNLALLLDSQMTTAASKIGVIREQVQRFEMNGGGVIDASDDYIDLSDFARLVEVNFSNDDEIRLAAQSVISAVREYTSPVFNERHRTGNVAGKLWKLDNSYGVSIFFPSTASSFYNDANYDFATGANWRRQARESLNLEQATIAWGPMLVNYFQTSQPNGSDDPEPPSLIPRLLQQKNLVFLPLLHR